MSQSRVKAVLRALLVSYIFTGIFLVLLAFLLYQFRLGEKQVGMAVNVIYVVTCIIGGFAAGKGIRQRRFFWGLLSGLLYFLILLGMSFAMQKGLKGDMADIVKVLAMCAAGGMLGGMLS